MSNATNGDSFSPSGDRCSASPASLMAAAGITPRRPKAGPSAEKLSPAKRSRATNRVRTPPNPQPNMRVDPFCWQCHGFALDNQQVRCRFCRRTFHQKCWTASSAPVQRVGSPGEEATAECIECQAIREETENSNSVLARVGADKLKQFYLYMVQFIEEKLSKDEAGPFAKNPRNRPKPAVEEVVSPAVLVRLKHCVSEGRYFTYAQFLADLRGLAHRSLLLHGVDSGYSRIALFIVETCKQLCNSMDWCVECFNRCLPLPDESLTDAVLRAMGEPCSALHCIVSIRLQERLWPAVLYKFDGSCAYVRFFGTLEFGRVPKATVFLLNEDFELEGPDDPKRDRGLYVNALRQCRQHIGKLLLIPNCNLEFFPRNTPYDGRTKIQVEESSTQKTDSRGSTPRGTKRTRSPDEEQSPRSFTVLSPRPKPIDPKSAQPQSATGTSVPANGFWSTETIQERAKKTTANRESVRSSSAASNRGDDGAEFMRSPSAETSFSGQSSRAETEGSGSSARWPPVTFGNPLLLSGLYGSEDSTNRTKNLSKAAEQTVTPQRRLSSGTPNQAPADLPEAVAPSRDICDSWLPMPLNDNSFSTTGFPENQSFYSLVPQNISNNFSVSDQSNSNPQRTVPPVHQNATQETLDDVPPGASNQIVIPAPVPGCSKPPDYVFQPRSLSAFSLSSSLVDYEEGIDIEGDRDENFYASAFSPHMSTFTSRPTGLGDTLRTAPSPETDIERQLQTFFEDIVRLTEIRRAESDRIRKNFEAIHMDCVRRFVEAQEHMDRIYQQQILDNQRALFGSYRATNEAFLHSAVFESGRKQGVQEKARYINATKRAFWCCVCRKRAQLLCCSVTLYCSEACQVTHFPEHQVHCRRLLPVGQEDDSVVQTPFGMLTLCQTLPITDMPAEKPDEPTAKPEARENEGASTTESKAVNELPEK